MILRGFPPLAALFSALTAGTLSVLSMPSPQTRGAQGPGLAQLQDYAGVRTVIDWSLDELRHHVPELKGLEPAASAEESSEKLSPILTKVGENVRAFFENFPNTTSIERIHTDFLYGDGRLRRDFSQEYNYLMLAASEKGRATLEEFRTEPGNSAAKRVRPGGVLITEGFASGSIHFHPSYQPDSIFRYVGRQRVGGQETEVVAFAQRPAIARNTGELSVGSNSVPILVQGVAWIDSASYQIRRLRTDLLAPRPEIGVQRETTIIQYGAVYFKGVTQVQWLPKEVEVIVIWRNTTLHNDHTYSHFRLFSVESEHRENPPK
jgi:hypothetical protein